MLEENVKYKCLQIFFVILLATGITFPITMLCVPRYLLQPVKDFLTTLILATHYHQFQSSKTDNCRTIPLTFCIGARLVFYTHHSTISQRVHTAHVIPLLLNNAINIHHCTPLLLYNAINIHYCTKGIRLSYTITTSI